MFAIGAKKSAIPTPARMNGTMSDEYATVGVDTSPIHASAAACSDSPVPTSTLPGTRRSESAPAIGAMNIGASVHGRIRSPEPSGE